MTEFIRVTLILKDSKQRRGRVSISLPADTELLPIEKHDVGVQFEVPCLVDLVQLESDLARTDCAPHHMGHRHQLYVRRK